MSLIMRSVAQPAMTKDGIGWGAHTGVTAAFLAKAGFTATASAFAADTASWADLGRRWRIEDLYLKLYPCCRWAQPAVAAAARLREAPAYLPAQVKTVTITTFETAAALAADRPTDTEQAQYSLRWPVASMLAGGRFGVAEALGPYDDKQTLEIFDRIRVEVSPAYTAKFPARRLTSVTVGLSTGETLHSGTGQAPGEAADADWLAQAAAKARTLLGQAPPWPASLRKLATRTREASPGYQGTRKSRLS
jgi:2-methylcitrate dehydratase PrpD